MTARPLTDDSLPTDTRSRQRKAFLIVGALALLHIVQVWGYTGLFWGDHGQWLDEVSQFAGGAVPYRDFSWSSPPLALWIIGGVARLTGTSLGAISATTTVLYLLIVALFLYVLKRLTPQLVLPIALPALICATAYASRSGAPLPLGTVSPGGPVGFLFLLGAAAIMLNAVDHLSRRAAMLAGVLAGLSLLSRQDYWLSASYTLLAGTILLARRRATMDLLLAPIAACAVTVGLGSGVAIWQSGLVPFLRMLIGPEDIVGVAVRAVPSLEHLTLEVAAVTALGLIAVTSLWLCLAISDRNAGRWAGAFGCLFLTAMAVHLGMSVAIGRGLVATGPEPLPTVTEEMMWQGLQGGRSLMGAAITFFDGQLQAHLFPVSLAPILLSVLVLRWRHWHDRTLANRLALLLGLCVVARLHRGFDSPEWYNVMLEVPCFALFLQLICGPATQKAARTVRAALSVVILLGLYSELRMGRGPLTLSGSFPVTMTHAGPVHWAPFPASAYRKADSLVTTLDSSGRRGLYAFGASGGWNYFLGRRNPSPASGGLEAGPWPLDTVLSRLRNANPAVFLLDNRYALRPTPGPLATLLRWEPEPQPNRFARHDREPFVALTRGCAAVGGDSIPGPFAVWDCAHRASPGTTRPGSSR
jgi:uncharacterized membrane protein YhaH (DUF805 family)